MKMKSMVLFAVALGFGTIAMLGVQKALSKGGSKKEETVKVLVAVTDISPGIPLDSTNTVFKPWPKATVPEGAVTRPEDFENRSLLVRAFRGDVISAAKLGEPGFHSLTGDIPDGMRVVTVPVDATKTHSGLMMPGNRVDVLVTYKARNKSNNIISRTKAVLENIKVFATDNRRDMKGADVETANAAKNISLLVTPDQGNLLMLAENKGKLHLALRGDRDEEQANAVAVDDDIFEDAAVGYGSPDSPIVDEGGVGDVRQFLEQSQSNPPPVATPDATAAAPAAPEKPKWKVTIFAGGEAKTQEVELPEEAVTVPAPPTPSADAGAEGTKVMFRGEANRFSTAV